jgi:serine/threonine protein kinase/WD40 repeat protein
VAGDNPDDKPSGFDRKLDGGRARSTPGGSAEVDRTIQGHGTDATTEGVAATVAAPAPRAQPKSPFGKTITAPPIASAATVASDSVPPSASTSSNASSPRSGARSTVGNELRGASIERFTPVDNGRFELLDELARGGLGRVFRARDPRTGRIVAIKEVLRPQQDIILRFAREALVTANLQHPSIVPVYEVGRWPTGEPFYAMKLVEGRTLDALIGESTTRAQRLALLPHVIDVAEALAYAHGEHVIHRDLKPANVLVGSYGETVVIDWGLAKNLATGEEIEALPTANTIPPEQGETVAGSVLGTPAYMPPEQAIGDKLDERADVYAIGAILYHALSGTRPFAQAKTLDELLELVAFKAPTPLAQLAPDLPPELVAIVEHAMARDPAQRYATAQGVAKDLRDFQAGKLVAAHEYTTRQLIRRWISRHKAVVATAAVALGVLIVVGAVGVWRITNERDEANKQRAIAQSERSDAQSARALAEKRFADSLQELARQALIAGDPAKALPLAAGALAAHRDARIATPSGRGPQGAAAPDVASSMRIDSDVPVALAVIVAPAYAGLVSVVPSPSFGVHAGVASPSGDRFYTASGGDETVRAWDVAKDAEVWRSKAGYMVAASRDGTHLLAASNAGELVILRATDGSELARWKVANTRLDVPTSLAWSPDHVHFAASSETGKVWFGALGGAAPRALDGHTTKISTLEFSPDGVYLSSSSTEADLVVLHDGRTGVLKNRIMVTKGGVWGLGWLDADHLLVGDERYARTYNIRTFQTEMSLDHGTWVYGFATGGPPDKRWLLTYGETATASLWDLATRTKIANLAGHNQAVMQALVIGDWLVTADELGNGFVWDPRTGERAQMLPRDSVIVGLAVRGDRLYVFRESRQEIWKLPPIAEPIAAIQRIEAHTARIRQLFFEGNDVLWTASHDGSARRTALDGSPPRVFGTPGFTESFRSLDEPDAKKPPYAHGLRSLELVDDLAITASEDGAIVAWDIATAKPRTTFTGHTRARSFALTADRKTMFSVGDTTLRRWNVATGEQTGLAELGDNGWDVAVFPDGTIATLTDSSPTSELALWSADLQKKLFDFESVFTHDLHIDSGRLLVGTFSQVYVLDAAGKVLANAPQPKVFSTSRAIRPDGSRWFVAGDPRGDIALHDETSGAIVRSWTASDGIVVSVAFSPDGELVASISGNRVRIWDPHTGALLATTPQLPAVLAHLAWSADGTRLAFAGSVGTVWIWDVRSPAALSSLDTFARCASSRALIDASVVRTTIDASCRLLAPSP